MRELKFRVWEEREKEYDTFSYYLTADGVLYRNVYGQFIPTDSGYIIEQYTGLKDINGNEIYEGDILEDGEGEPFEYYAVKFENGKFIGSTQGVDEDIFELTDLEVIGNIHENPELLEGKNNARIQPKKVVGRLKNENHSRIR